MKRLALALTLVLSACASDKADGPASSSGPGAAAATPPMAVTERQAAPITPIPAQAAAPKPAPDQCGAYELQGLIGQPRTAIPVPVDPSKRRVVCTTCPMTEDFRPDRLTILFDAETGLVTKAQCQ